MTIFIGVVAFIISWQFYRWVGRMSRRGVQATEASAAALQAIYDAMPPEAQARAYVAQQQRAAAVRQKARDSGIRRMMILVGIICFIALIAAISHQ